MVTRKRAEAEEDFEARFGPPMGSPANSNEKKAFTILDADTLVASSNPYVVKDLFASVGLSVLVGVSGSAKTFAAVDIAIRIAQGRMVFGRRSRLSGVVYVGAEAPDGLKKRFEAARTVHGPAEGRVGFIAGGPNLADTTECESLEEALRVFKEKMQSRGETLRVVFIDTLSASIPGADENSSADMSKVLAHLQALAARLELSIILVAHFGKNVDRGVRGWSGMHANVDTVISIKLDEKTGVRIVSFDKVKDGECGGQVAFRLVPIELGQDDDGDPITSCTIEECPLPEAAERAAPKLVLDDDRQLILQAMDRLIDDMIELPRFDGVPGGKRGLTIRQVREFAFGLGFGAIGEPDSDADDGARRRWGDARRKRFDRALQRLVDARVLRVAQKWVWTIG